MRDDHFSAHVNMSIDSILVHREYTTYGMSFRCVCMAIDSIFSIQRIYYLWYGYIVVPLLCPLMETCLEHVYYNVTTSRWISFKSCNSNYYISLHYETSSAYNILSTNTLIVI